MRRFTWRELQHDESGQALVYVALILAVIVAALFALFDLGRLTSAKIKAQNAADAAALAAVSVKVSVHHTRELAYLAMTDQGLRARLELIKALANITNDTEFQHHIDNAEKHIQRIERLREKLQLYNAWVDEAGPEIVADAARMAYAANIRGVNAHLTSGRALDEENLHLLDAPEALRENSKEAQTLGGVIYPLEGLGSRGVGGKSYVEVAPKYQGFNWSVFGSGAAQPVELPTWAAAGIASSDAIVRDPAAKGKDLKWNIPVLGTIGLNWYAPRLVRTGQKKDGGFGSGGGVVSEH